MSTKSTSAPQYKPQLADATKVLEKSTECRLSPHQELDKCKPDVALFIATACLAPTFFATASSNRGTFGPCVKNLTSELQQLLQYHLQNILTTTIT